MVESGPHSQGRGAVTVVIRRRTTIEEYEGDENVTRTETRAPTLLVGRRSVSSPAPTPEVSQATQNESVQTSSGTSAVVEPVGRTYADLVVNSFNKPRVMALVITFFSFAVFAPWTNTFNSLAIPAVVALLCNVVWFCFPLLERLKLRILGPH